LITAEVVEPAALGNANGAGLKFASRKLRAKTNASAIKV
jgi:hypothetical protein